MQMNIGRAVVAAALLAVVFGVWGWALWDTRDTAWVPRALILQKEAEERAKAA